MQGAAARYQHDPRRGVQQLAQLAAHQVAAHSVDGALGQLGMEARPGLAAAHCGVYAVLQILHIGGDMLVHDHQIHGQPLHPQVFVGQQQLMHLGQILHIVDAQQHDGQIPRDGLLPEGRLPRQATGYGGRGGAESGIPIEQGGGQPLEVGPVGGLDVEMVQLHLGLGPGQRLGPLEGVAVVVLVDEIEQCRPRGGHQGPEGDMGAAARQDMDPLAQGEDGVEHCARGVGEGDMALQGVGGGQGAPLADEAGTVGFILQGPGQMVLDDDEVGGPHLLLLGGSGPPGGNQGPQLGQVFGDHKELAESRVGAIRLRCGQHQLGIGGELDMTKAATAVAQGDAPHFPVRLTGDQHLQGGGQAIVMMNELGAILGENHLSLRIRVAKRMSAGGPGLTALDIMEEEEGAPVVAGGVLLPAGDGDVAPAAVTRPGSGEHDAVAAIGEQVGDRGSQAGRGEAAHRAHLEAALGEGGLDLGGVGPNDGHVLGDPLLQQQIAGLHHGVFMETGAHLPPVKGVGEGHYGHPLVVGHEALHYGNLLAVGQARGGKVEGLVEAVTAAASHGGQPLEVCQGRPRVDHGGQPGGIGGDHPVLGQPALEGELGDAEIGVLVGELHVPGVVSGLRDAPGDAEGVAVADLGVDDQPAGLLKLRADRGPHHQGGHQVLEHGAGPGDEGGPCAQGGGRPSQPEPVAGDDIPLGDGKQAGQPRLRGEQIVTAAVEPVVGEGVADGEQAALLIEQEPEVHPHGEGAGLGCHGVQPSLAYLGVGGLILQMFGHHPLEGLQPEEELLPLPLTGLQVELVRRVAGLHRQPGEHRELVGCRQGAGELATDFLEAGAEGLHLAALLHGVSLQGLLRQQAGIQDAAANGAVPRLLLPAIAAGGDHQQVAGQVAAVHRRDIGRLQGEQAAGVVPVEEVTLETGQTLHHGQGGFQPREGGAAPGPAKIIGRQGGEQIEPHVGGGGAMGDDLLRTLLHVVRRQLVVQIGDQGLEIAPGLAGNQAQLGGLGGSAAHLSGEVGGAAGPVGHQRSQQPEQADRQHQGPGGGGSQQGEAADPNGKHHPGRHQPIKPGPGQAR
ncbi:hypothetical protein D3C84_249780 [compost metagenome]